MLERGVEVDIVRDGEREERLDVVERDRVACGRCGHGLLGHALPGVATLRQERVEEPSPRSTTASPERKPRCVSPPATERPESCSIQTELLQVGNGLEEGAAPDRDELLTADPRELVRSRLATAPAEATRRELHLVLERAGVRERAGGEHVQEAVPPVGRERVVQAGGRLERNARVATGLEEPPERGGRGNLRAAAAHLRAQPVLGEHRDLLLDPLAERQLDARLPGKPVEPCLPACLDGLCAQVAAVRPVEQNRERAVFAVELVQLRRRPHQPRQHPGVLVGAGAAVLVERVGHGEARRREERRMVDQVRERRAAGSSMEPSLEATQLRR